MVLILYKIFHLLSYLYSLTYYVPLFQHHFFLLIFLSIKSFLDIFLMTVLLFYLILMVLIYYFIHVFLMFYIHLILFYNLLETSSNNFYFSILILTFLFVYSLYTSLCNHFFMVVSLYTNIILILVNPFYICKKINHYLNLCKYLFFYIILKNLLVSLILLSLIFFILSFRIMILLILLLLFFVN